MNLAVWFELPQSSKQKVSIAVDKARQKPFVSFDFTTLYHVALIQLKLNLVPRVMGPPEKRDPFRSAGERPESGIMKLNNVFDCLSA